MAKGEFHIGPNGPGPCHADPLKPNSKGCPFGGKTGLEHHYTTIKEADASYVKIMEENHGMFSTSAARESRRGTGFGEDVEIYDHNLPMDEATEIATKILVNAGFQPMIVGGAVRDSLLGRAPKDFDIEIHGANSFEQIIKVLKGKAQLNQVGKTFGVIKAKMKLSDGSWSEDLDLSLPRRDSKIGNGHRGFKIEVDPKMGLREATARRDLTVNAMMWDPAGQQVIDIHGGTRDLRNGVLRHVSDAFDEDPLRVLRVARFSAKLGFTTADETLEQSRNLMDSFDELHPEGVVGEMKKMIVETHIANGFQSLQDTGWDQKMGELAKVNSPELSRKMKEAQEQITGVSAFNNASSKRVVAMAVMSKTLLENGSKDPSKTLVHFAHDKAELARAVAISKSEIWNIKAPISDSEARQLAWDNQKITSFEVLSAARASNPDKGVFATTTAQFWHLGILTEHEADHFDAPKIIRDHKAANPGIKDGPWIKSILQEHRTAQYERV